jgi:hypothetical protein
VEGICLMRAARTRRASWPMSKRPKKS